MDTSPQPLVAVAVPVQPKTLFGHVREWFENASFGEIVLTGAATGLGLAIFERLARRPQPCDHVYMPDLDKWVYVGNPSSTKARIQKAGR